MCTMAPRGLAYARRCRTGERSCYKGPVSVSGGIGMRGVAPVRTIRTQKNLRISISKAGAGETAERSTSRCQRPPCLYRSTHWGCGRSTPYTERVDSWASTATDGRKDVWGDIQTCAGIDWRRLLGSGYVLRGTCMNMVAACIPRPIQSAPTTQGGEPVHLRVADADQPAQHPQRILCRGDHRPSTLETTTAAASSEGPTPSAHIAYSQQGKPLIAHFQMTIGSTRKTLGMLSPDIPTPTEFMLRSNGPPFASVVSPFRRPSHMYRRRPAGTPRDPDLLARPLHEFRPVRATCGALG